MGQMEGKVIIVTGSASGLGRAISIYAGKLSAIVVATDINLEGAQETKRQVDVSGGIGEALQTDVTDETLVTTMIHDVKKRHGKIDFIFNNAGYAQNGEFQDITPEDFKKVIDVNFWGVVYGTRACYPIMIEQGYGTIANVTSLAGLIPGGLMTAYSSAKYAATGFTLNLRSEAKQYGVHVVAVCPGYLETPMHANADNVSEYIKSHDKEYRSKKHRYPTAEKVVGNLMRGVFHNRAIVVTPYIHLPFWWLYRIAPGAVPWAWDIIIRRIKTKEEQKII
jgi:NAD(P)-dependent dehydrogenase (short-subunit alcohol dehydrogenase family)